MVDDATRLFKILADPTRLRILHILRTGEICVGDLDDRPARAPANRLTPLGRSQARRPHFVAEKQLLDLLRSGPGQYAAASEASGVSGRRYQGPVPRCQATRGGRARRRVLSLVIRIASGFSSCSCAIGLVLGIGANAVAQTPPPPTPKPLVEAGLGRGVTIRAPDDTASLNIRARIQVRATALGAVDDAQPETTEIAIRRMRLVFQGNANGPRLKSYRATRLLQS